MGGAYYCAANVRMDSGSRGYYFKTLIALNDDTNSNNGLSVMEGNMGSNNYRNMNVAGTLWMKAGQYTSLYVYSNGDNSWYVDDSSGFGCHFLDTKFGFLADLQQDTQYFGRGTWYRIKGWRTAGVSTLYAVGTGASDDAYTVPTDGYYVCNVNMRIDSMSSGQVRVRIVVNGVVLDGNNGLSSISGSRDSTNYRDMTIAGTAKFMKGDSLSVHVYSDGDNSWRVHSESGVFVVTSTLLTFYIQQILLFT